MGVVMSEISYYKGKHKVRVVTESVGYLTVEALEDFEDTVGGEKFTVKTGETRIVAISDVRRERAMLPMVKEHAYELTMEKKLKQLVAQEEKKEGKTKKP